MLGILNYCEQCLLLVGFGLASGAENHIGYYDIKDDEACQPVIHLYTSLHAQEL